MSLPALSRPAADPPLSPLPPIPTSKYAKKALPQTPSRLKTPSRPSALPTPQTIQSTPEVPTYKSAAQAGKGGIPTPQTVRKTVSIGQFPHPPNNISRPGTAQSLASPTSPRKRTSDANRVSTSTAAKLRKTPRYSGSSNVYRNSDTPSLLNSTIPSSAIPLVDNKRSSDGQSSIPSPPQSRSSSANGSYSTSATTFEEGDEERGRAKENETVQSPKTGKGKEHKGNVIVSVRVRPDTNGHESSTSEGEWMVDGRRSLIAYRGKEGGDYVYDNVFGTYDDNAKVYDSAAKRLVRRVMEGYHGTVFAYGMTGTGKTFSMQGTTTSPGVIPLAITDIFSYIRETPHREFLLRVSYLEIYNEKIHDLLAAPANGAAGGPQEEIKLREDSRRGVYASPLKEEIVQSPTQLLRVIHRGDLARRTGSTQWNARSSRSHAVVQIVVESRERTSGGATQESKRIAMLPSGVRVSTLSLIDLAGSERAADDKERQKEGAHINKSLLTLGTVISKLSASKDKNGNPIDKDGKHLPYRDSKLTRLLQPALSGSSLVSILCTIQIGSTGTSTTATTHAMENLNTLKFAARAKNNIVSHAKKATEEVGSGVNAGLLERYRAEIANLRSQLDIQKKSTETKEEKQEEESVEKTTEVRHEEQMLEMQLARTALKERIEHLNRLILCSKSTGVNSRMTSAMGMHGRLSSGTVTDFVASRSVRSSASHSTLGTFGPSVSRHPSMASINGAPATFSPVVDEEDDGGEYGDGVASLQAQNRALQADLQDKNRYITTLEKRLLQARRSSHSRTSVGFSRSAQEETDMHKQLDEKDAVIADLQKTVTALRSAMRQRSVADMTPDSSSGEFKSKKGLRIQLEGQEQAPQKAEKAEEMRSPSGGITPMGILSPQRIDNKKRRSVDEMSRMLDEMIQDKVESGQLVKGKTGSVRVPPRSASTQRHSRRASSANEPKVAPLNSMVAALREPVSTA